jgi:hypoxanthine phosphoribosyltransferase
VADRLGGEKVEVLLAEAAIRERVESLGRRITADYAGRHLCLVGVLKGSFVFLADLVRAIDLPLTVDFIGISSYVGTASSGAVTITSDLARPIEGLDVLLVEDIVDTGLTARHLLDTLARRRPRSLKVCALLVKPSRATVRVTVDYRGFEIPDHFAVGYGLDHEGRFRNLPFVGALTRAA